MNKPFIVGITGGSASGKTMFLNSLLSHFHPDEICLVSQDNYYRDRHLQPKDENGIENFDTPQSIEFDEYAHDIKELKLGNPVYRKEYTFNNPNIVPKMLEFKPSKIIVVEGLFVLYFPELTNLLDLKVFIDAKDYVKLKRRIVRDNTERGYDLEDVLYRYEKHVAPTYEKYIEPFKYDADIIIPNNTKFDKGLDVLVSYLKSKSV
jgi:uridine kinase